MTAQYGIKIVVDDAAANASVAALDARIRQIGGNSAPAGLNATTQALQGMGAANPALAQVASNLTGVSTAAGGASNSLRAANDNIRGIGDAARSASGGILETIGHLGKMTLALAGIGFFAQGVHELAHAFIEAADEATMVTARVMSFATSSKEAAEAQASIARIATETRQPLENISELYQKISLAGEALGITQTQAGIATKVFAETLKLSGSNVAQQKGAILQLADAFDIGKLQGRHFMAMMMDNVVFMNMLAQSMGVSKAKLGELAHEGKITGETLKTALTDPKMVAEIEARFGKIPVSFQDVRTAIKNTLIQLAGDFMSGAGINESLGVLYAKIAAWGTSAKETFIKIGQAFKAAVSTFAPLFTAAWEAIKPLFGVILNNAPAIIQLIKVMAEGWVAYRIAVAGVMAVSMASKLMTEASALAFLMKTATGAGTVMSYLKAGFAAAAAGVDILTGAIAANPIGAIAVAITVVIGLLYEFRDSIGLGGGTMASFGDLVRAVWESIGPMVTKVGEVIQSVFGSITGWIGGAMSAVSDIFGVTFEGFDFSIAGAIRAVARFADFLVNGMRTAFNVMAVLWNNFPGFLQAIFASAANLALSKVEALANGIVGAINTVIKGAQGLGVNISTIANVKLGRVEAGGFQDKLKAATAGAYTTSASDGAEALLARAGQIGAKRRADAALRPPAGATTPNHVITGDEGGDDKDGSKAAKKAAERLKNEQNFWAVLKNEAVTAAMLPAEAAQYNKEQALRKILGDGNLETARQLTAQEKAQIAALLQQKALGEIIRDIKIGTRNANFENQHLQEVQTIMTTSTGKALAANLAIEEKIWPFKLKALEAGISLEDEGLKKQLAVLTARERENYLLGQRNDLMAKTSTDTIAYAKDAVKTDGTPAEKRALLQGEYDKLLANLQAALGSGMPGGEFRAAVTKAGRELRDDLKKAGLDFYDTFSKLGHELGSMIGGPLGDAINKISDIVGLTSKGSFADTSKKFGDQVTSLFGSNSQGPLAQGIGKAVGGAMAGLQIGESVAGLAKIVGLNKGAQDGAKIGGAIGGLTGNPLIALGASVVGGLIGSLFYHAPKGASIITSGTSSQITGNKADVRDQLAATTGSIQNGLQSIASQLGGSVGSFMVSLGKYKDNFRVSSTGASNVDIKKAKYISGLIYDGKDEAMAIRIAIKDAIQDGAIIGISDLMDKALKTLAGNLDKALSTAVKIKTYEDDFKAMFDPLGAAIDAVKNPLDSLKDTFNEIGATTAELTKLEQYRAAKIEQLVKDQTKTLTDLKETLTNTGKPVLQQLNADLSAFEKFKTDIAGGKQVDQTAFSNLAGKINTEASTVYGTSTSQFNDIRNMLVTATDGAIANVNTTISNATVQAIDANTTAVTGAIYNQTQAIIDALRAGGGAGFTLPVALQLAQMRSLSV
ncbi:tape measure protein [Sphingomonas sp. AR_OL41]|uniref:tape measure protein n=1 Tax=Sphingomonas sp. AR_OL41 TaxID=3042729 RepID=UPI002481251F|nr:tape measure protein [Sphingomonas sp. AR_OL41]MDH7971037.1 tape measure protein [Sphingomonas sp. AR_OL41]